MDESFGCLAIYIVVISDYDELELFVYGDFDRLSGRIISIGFGCVIMEINALIGLKLT